MSELTPEMLVEKMKNAVNDAYVNNLPIQDAVLRVFLKAIQDGEIIDRTYNDMSGRFIYHDMKPSYQKFLESGA